MLLDLPGGPVGFLIAVNIFIFVLPFFLDFFEIAFIVIPLLAPVAAKLGIDLIWFGVLLGANMQTSFMHPPFGFALFYLRGIAPRDTVPSSDIYWGAIPWVILQLMLVAIVIVWPASVTYWLDKAPPMDPSKVEIRIPSLEIPGAPSFNIGPPPGMSGPPGVSLPPGLSPPPGLTPPALPAVPAGPGLPSLPTDLIAPKVEAPAAVPAVPAAAPAAPPQAGSGLPPPVEPPPLDPDLKPKQ